jgi:hypothetical protein
MVREVEDILFEVEKCFPKTCQRGCPGPQDEFFPAIITA